MKEDDWYPEEYGLYPQQYLPMPSIEEIKKRAYLPASPIPDSDKIPLAVARQHLEVAFDRIYVPTKQACALIRHFYEDAFAWSLLAYPSTEYYNRKVYSSDANWGETNGKISYLTGLAGCGKSKLIEAMKRVFPPQELVYLHPGLIDLKHHSIVHFSLNATSARKKLILDQLNRMSRFKTSPALGIDVLIAKLAQNAYAYGTSRVILDELQFLVNTEGSISKASQYLISMGKIGVPVLFVTNYDLLHRLLTTPKQQETQRLLHTPHELHPEPADSDDWLSTLTEMCTVAPEVFRFDIEENAQLLHQYTAGLVRPLRILLTIAFNIARENDRTVDRQILEAAYKSAGYEPQARDIRIIHEQAFLPSADCKRKDLASPLQPDNKRLEFMRQSEEKRLEKATAQAIYSALTASEKKALESQNDNDVEPKGKKLIKRHEPENNTWADMYARALKSESKH